jgi:hypothetical protein
MVLISAPLAGVAVLQLLASITEPAPRTADPVRHFPRFAEQKAAITSIALVADLAEFELRGSTLYLADCRRLGARLADTLAAALAAKGYPIRSQGVVGVGFGAGDEAKKCRVYPDWATRDASEPSPPGGPPFWADSALAGTPATRDAWRAIAHATFVLKTPNPKKDSAPVMPGIDAVRDALGADCVLVAIGLGTKNAIMWASPFGEGGRVADYSPWPGSEVRIALVDCRSGTVLWADRAHTGQGFSNHGVDAFVRDLAAEMP